MKQTDLQKENKKLKRINFILIIYVVISIVIQLYNILAKSESIKSRYRLLRLMYSKYPR